MTHQNAESVPVETENTISWFKPGTQILHRVDGPAVEYKNGNTSWYLNGLRHREDGPAVTSDSGYRMYYLDGALHRLDGPAVHLPNGNESFYIAGLEITESNFKAFTQRNTHQTSRITDIKRLLNSFFEKLEA